MLAETLALYNEGEAGKDNDGIDFCYFFTPDAFTLEPDAVYLICQRNMHQQLLTKEEMCCKQSTRRV